MNKKTKYWITGLIILALLFIICIFALNQGRDDPADGHAGHTKNSEAATAQPSGAKSQENDDVTDYVNEQNIIMMNMMDDMHNLAESGSASIDFLKGMLPHHESAVEMSENYLQKENINVNLKKIAEDIITAQKAEIKQMDSMIQTLIDSKSEDKVAENKYLEEYDSLFAGSHSHHMNASDIQSVDVAFAKGMIEHHQMAVDMSELILKYTDQEEVKTFAQSIIDVQDQEIAQMQDIMDDLS